MKYVATIFLLSSCIFSKKVVTNPTTVILDGSASKIIGGNGTGYIKSWYWRQIEGNYFLIQNPNTMITETTVNSGTYAWELTGIDNENNIGKDTFYIKIN